MSRTISTRAVALLLGAAALAVAISLISPRSDAQHAISAQPIGSWWPPHPRDQVQIYSPGTTLPAGGVLELFVVPNDRWLVLVPTGHLALQGTVGRVGIDHASTGAVHLAEQLGALQTEKARNAPVDGVAETAGPATSSSLGWTFRPGSRVVLVYGDGAIGDPISYNLFGYLAPL